MAVGQDNSAEAAQYLHEDRVSELVQRVLAKFDQKRWILFHARDYLLGVLQLLDDAGLLRDVEDEQRAFKIAVETRTLLETRMKAYSRMAHIAAAVMPDSFIAELDHIGTVHNVDELNSGTKLTNLEVASWAHGGSSADAIALAKVRKLARESYKRKTISRTDLLKALGETDGR